MGIDGRGFLLAEKAKPQTGGKDRITARENAVAAALNKENYTQSKIFKGCFEDNTAHKEQ